MSNSLWPHGRQLARFLCPWHFPGKNTGVCCHFLLQGIFPTQGLNLGLLHCWQILYQVNHQGGALIKLSPFNVVLSVRGWVRSFPAPSDPYHRLACQSTSHLRACRGWTVQKTFIGTSFSLLIRKGMEESTGKQMLWCSNPSFFFSPSLFYLGKIGFQLFPTKRRQKTIRESLWSLTVTLGLGIRPHLSYPRLCRSKGPLRSRNGGMPRYSLLRMPRSAWGRPPANEETQWGVQPTPLVGAQGRPSDPSHRDPTLLRKELPRVRKLIINRKPGAALGSALRGWGRRHQGGREEEDRERERGEGREGSRPHSCREGITCVEGRCSICHES